MQSPDKTLPFLRYFLEIAYKGTHYHGWQVQQNAHTIQAEIEKRISILLGNNTEIVGSGRTDTGVHAEQQFAHFDSDIPLKTSRFAYQLNALLPHDIVIKNIYQVSDIAHARFDAISRSYQYRISKFKNPFLHQLVYFNHFHFYLDRMNQASDLLKNYQNFQSFSKVKTDVTNFTCQITEAFWEEQNDLLVFQISANRFLRGMVRAIVGTMLLIGQHKLNLTDFEKVIESKDRKKAGKAVPPEGLFLTKVVYPFELRKVTNDIN